MKICIKCKQTKEPTEFSKNSAARDGLRSTCKTCSNTYNSARYKDNPEKFKAAHKAWNSSNKDKHRAATAAWDKANAGKKMASNKAWISSNNDKYRAMISAWAASHPEKRKIYRQNRRAKEIAAGGKLSHGLAEKLLILQKGKCPCCKQPLGDNYHLDHIMPLSIGGTNTDDNIQLLRATCNLQKHAAHPVDFMQSRGFLL